MTAKTCPSCHRPLPPEAPGDLCPACVLLGASADPSPAGVPSIDEIQAAFPQFEILECIGRGGMGVVYKVRQPQLDRLLALKILLPGLDHDPGFAERFAREARALAKLGHPNIVAVHDFGETGGFFWLTMEYVDGVNLRQAMQAARFTPAQALALIPDLCAALQYAHDHGVLHRDIKPENILLDARGKVKIADFGIARIAGEDHAEFTLTRTGSILGSAAYIAPEQIERPQDVDHRADLYSLGVVFYEMLTAELPLGRFPAPSEKSTSDPQLDAVVFRSLEKEREKRFQRAEDFRENLASPAGSPVKNETTTPVYADIPLTTAFAAILTSISLIFGIPAIRQWVAFSQATLAQEGVGSLSSYSYLSLILPSLTASVVLPGLSGTVLGTVSLFMIRASNGKFRGIRLAGFAAFAWPAIFIVLVFTSLIFTIFIGQYPSDQVLGYFNFPYCLSLALLTGLISKWLLASWLGVPRNGEQVWGKTLQPLWKPPGKAVTPATTRFSISAIIAAMLTGLSLVVGVPVIRSNWPTFEIGMRDPEVMMTLIPSLTLQLPQIIPGMILPALCGTVLGIVSLFMIRSSDASVRGIRIAGFAAFSWLAVGGFFSFIVRVLPLFREAQPRYYLDQFFQLPLCLALAIMAGWCSEWLLAGWLGIPRTRELLCGRIPPWLILLVFAAYVAVTLLIVFFNVQPNG